MNGKIKKMLSAVSITLCATVGLSLPVDVVAATLPKTETQYSSFDNIVGENPEESKIVKELTGERTENSKEFLLEDGTKMTAQYNEPVHYKDSKGKWVEYNNTLSEDKTASPDEAGDSSYTNKSSDISVNLSNKAKSKNMISLQSNGYKISWGYDNAGKSKADVKKNTLHGLHKQQRGRGHGRQAAEKPCLLRPAGLLRSGSDGQAARHPDRIL